jgi:hypothetical protein
MGTWEQVLRILLYNGAGMWLGKSVADGEMTQAAISGIVALATFGWWLYQQRKSA